MEPNLRDGDWLLVDPDAFMRRSPSVGELVVARDPREAGRLIVKRVSSVEAGGGPVVGGDHPAHADELISVSVADLCGRPWFRYWPLRRFGRLS